MYTLARKRSKMGVMRGRISGIPYIKATKMSIIKSLAPVTINLQKSTRRGAVARVVIGY